MKIFLDLDGVVVDTLPLDRYRERDIFSECTLIEGAEQFIEDLKGNDVMVLSKTFYPTKHTHYKKQKEDKLAFIKSLGLKGFVIGAEINKSVFARGNRVLIDDYGENLRQWIENGGLGVQAFEHKFKRGFPTANNYQELLEKVSQMASARVDV